MAEEPKPRRIVLEIKGVTKPLHIWSLTGREEISQLFSYELELSAPGPELDPATISGSLARIGNADGSGSPIAHGMINHFEVHDEQPWAGSARPDDESRWICYRARLGPAAWKMNQRINCHIFQQQDACAIVKDLLDAAGVEHDFNHRDGKPPAERVYCAQYEESNWRFIQRLLAEEGYSFFFTHEPDRHVMQIGNHAKFYLAIAGNAQVPYRRQASGSELQREHVARLALSGAVRPDGVTMRDLNLERPDLNLEKKLPTDKDAQTPVFVYPGDYDNADLGQTRVEQRLQHLRQDQLVAAGTSTCTRLAAGRTFEVVEGHLPEATVGKQLLILEVRQRIDQAWFGNDASAPLRCTNTFKCVPLELPFRPTPLPKPRIAGVQTALVVGDGEEIHTDKLRRIKAQFTWDQLDQQSGDSSCWVPVAQTIAGAGWGTLFTPRVGQHVVITFINGDPDRPVAIGGLYSTVNVPPYDDKQKTVSTIKSDSSPGHKGFNELRFDDKADTEQVFFQAQRNRTDLIKADYSQSVGHDASVSVGNDYTETVSKNYKQTIGDGGSKKEITVNGDHKEEISGNAEVTVKKDSDEKVTKKKTLKAQMLTERVTAHREEHAGTETITVSKKSELNVGTERVVTVKGKCTISSTEDEVQISAGGSTITVGKDGSITLTAAEELKLTCGAASLGLKKDGSVAITGTKEVNVGSAASSVVLKPDSTTTNSPKITSQAVGVHEIVGAMVKIN